MRGPPLCRNHPYRPMSMSAPANSAAAAPADSCRAFPRPNAVRLFPSRPRSPPTHPRGRSSVNWISVFSPACIAVSFLTNVGGASAAPRWEVPIRGRERLKRFAWVDRASKTRRQKPPPKVNNNYGDRALFGEAKCKKKQRQQRYAWGVRCAAFERSLPFEVVVVT